MAGKFSYDEAERSCIVFDEVHIIQKIKDEPVEHVTPGRSVDVGLHNCIQFEVTARPQNVHYGTDISCTYFKDAERLKKHHEISPECKPFNKCVQSVDGPGEPCDITTDVERSRHLIPSGSHSDPTSNIKSFVEPMKITVNIKSSSVRKRHTCYTCNRTFTQKGTLSRHIIIHTGVNPFSCSVCNQTFKQQSNLNQHKLKHTGERPFICDVCKQTFSKKSDLSRHNLIHTGERPFSCDICKQTFTQKGVLNRHKLKHTGIQPFACVVCDQTFIQRSDLNKHTLKHTCNPFVL